MLVKTLPEDVIVSISEAKTKGPLGFSVYQTEANYKYINDFLIWVKLNTYLRNAVQKFINDCETTNIPPLWPYSGVLLQHGGSVHVENVWPCSWLARFSACWWAGGLFCLITWKLAACLSCCVNTALSTLDQTCHYVPELGRFRPSSGTSWHVYGAAPSTGSATRHSMSSGHLILTQN